MRHKCKSPLALATKEGIIGHKLLLQKDSSSESLLLEVKALRMFYILLMVIRKREPK